MKKKLRIKKRLFRRNVKKMRNWSNKFNNRKLIGNKIYKKKPIVKKKITYYVRKNKIKYTY